MLLLPPNWCSHVFLIRKKYIQSKRNKDAALNFLYYSYMESDSSIFIRFNVTGHNFDVVWISYIERLYDFIYHLFNQASFYIKVVYYPLYCIFFFLVCSYDWKFMRVFSIFVQNNVQIDFLVLKLQNYCKNLVKMIVKGWKSAENFYWISVWFWTFKGFV